MKNPIRIEFDEPREYIGRNGTAKAIAIEIHYCEATRTVTTYPINSRQQVGACEIQIPFSSITEIIQAYNNANLEPVFIDTSNQAHLKKVQAMVCDHCGKKGFFEPKDFEVAKCEFCGYVQYTG